MKRIVSEDALILEGECKTLAGNTNRLAIICETNSGLAAIRLEGTLDSDISIALTDELLAYLSMGYDLRLDMSKVDYIAPETVKQLIKMQAEYVEQLDRQMILCGLPPLLMGWMHRNHYAQQFDFDRSVSK